MCIENYFGQNLYLDFTLGRYTTILYNSRKFSIKYKKLQGVINLRKTF